MLDPLLPEGPNPNLRRTDPALLAALELAAGAMGRLDEALDAHPLAQAFLYRVRLEAVRRQAAADGHGIDAWHLAAVLEGLPLNLPGQDAFERGNTLDAARIAFEHYGWTASPDVEQEGLIRDAETFLGEAAPDPAILGAARQMFRWLDAGNGRAPIRAGLMRHWRRCGLLKLPVPLTGPAALAADAPTDATTWATAFCGALASEARDYRELLRRLDQQWLQARQVVAGRRRDSRATMAIDVLAATPLCSATSLARMLDLSIKSALALLADLQARGLIVEVTHRSARRLFGLAGLAPIQEAVTAPRRSVPGRRPGRPRKEVIDRPEPKAVIPPLHPIARVRLPAIDYASLDAAMAHCEATIEKTRGTLETLVQARTSETNDD